MKKILLFLLAIAFYCIAVFAKTVKTDEVSQKTTNSQSSQTKTFY
jgi:Na+-transporting methylmalonyl-CoA/oxaloacetate decarboxylase gamma subunit